MYEDGRVLLNLVIEKMKKKANWKPHYILNPFTDGLNLLKTNRRFSFVQGYVIDKSRSLAEQLPAREYNERVNKVVGIFKLFLPSLLV